METSSELPLPPPPLSVKNASLADLLNVSYWLWRLNPSSTFPVILNSALEVLKQSIIVIAFIFGLSHLATTGILNELAESIRTSDFPRLISTISPIVSMLMPIIIATISIYYVVSIMAGGFLNSAEYGSYLRLVKQGMVSLKDAFEEMKVNWSKMAWTVFLVETIKGVPIFLVIALIFSDIIYLSSHVSEVLEFSLWAKIFGWLALAIIAEVFTLILSVLTLYAYPATVDGFHGFAAVKRSVNTCFKIPADTFVYCVLRGLSNLFIVGVSYVASLLNVQLSSIVTIVLSFLIVPVFHIFKITLFLKPEAVVIPLPIGPSVFKDVFPHVFKTGLKRIRKGLRELVNFIIEPKNLTFHMVSAVFFFLGVILGRQVSPLGIRQILYALGYVPGETNPLFENVLGLPFLALDISFHNWQVSLATAISGVVFVFPILTTLVFNGFILGIVEDIVQNSKLFLAAILPHGIIELPAFILAGSAGLKLGFTFLKTLKRGCLSSERGFYNFLRRTIYIVLGLIPVFIVAGIIEAFVTPIIMRLYGWS
jgi:uncharacterized membrane protein SpoIIM required for sporulation